MERRTFLRTLIGGVAAGAAVRTWPFRVYSFPSQVVLPENAFIWDNRIFWISDTRLDPKLWIVNSDQAEALDRLSYKVTHVDHEEKTITLEAIRQSRYNWKNLSRSPKPFRDGLT